ncbi:unnamed protein product, partial [Coregonus sp. 'balchen']
FRRARARCLRPAGGHSDKETESQANIPASSPGPCLPPAPSSTSLTASQPPWHLALIPTTRTDGANPDLSPRPRGPHRHRGTAH